jgi:hypothetical protein
MTLDAQNFGFTASAPVVLGQTLVLAVSIADVVEADIASMEWSLFDCQPMGGVTPSAEITKTIGDGVVLSDDGTDLTATITVTPADMADMEAGDYWWRLDGVKTAGDVVQFSRGAGRFAATA